MLKTRVLVFLLTFLLSLYVTKKQKINSDAGLNIEELVVKYGYPIERHEISTVDNFILTLHRIPHNGKQVHKFRAPVLLMHGFGQSAIDFLHAGLEKSLGYLLTEQGYDVWLGHVRGTTWSKKHRFFDPNKDKIYWDFSLDEIAVYDIPAFIDYILKATNQPSIFYIGYSQGTTLFYMMASEKPDYNKKVKLMTALAPAIYLNNSPSLIIQSLVYFRNVIKTLLDFFQIYEIFSQNSLISQYLKHICDENSLFVELCLFHLFSMHGFSYQEVNRTALSAIFTNVFAGSSRRQFGHILQFGDTGNFEKYDFGPNLNFIKYGQTQPLQYDLSKITAPVALYYACNDWAVPVQNMHKTVGDLPNIVNVYEIPDESFNHLDFLYGVNVVSLLYNEVLQEMSKYNLQNQNNL